MTGRADRWIRRTTIGCVALLALIAGTVSYLHMHALVALHGQPGWVAALTPLSADGMIVAASTSPAGGLPVRWPGRNAAVGTAGREQRGEHGRDRRGGRADGDGPSDRGVAIVRADRLSQLVTPWRVDKWTTWVARRVLAGQGGFQPGSAAGGFVAAPDFALESLRDLGESYFRVACPCGTPRQ